MPLFGSTGAPARTASPREQETCKRPKEEEDENAKRWGGLGPWLRVKGLMGGAEITRCVSSIATTLPATACSDSGGKVGKNYPEFRLDRCDRDGNEELRYNKKSHKDKNTENGGFVQAIDRVSSDTLSQYHSAYRHITLKPRSTDQRMSNRSS
ncbi:hypothetical protein M0802_000789 [Mischocyttarus mexicanus]|nr:hypothetical protein M0802_000789 [Mischocyttarus mexicanus]